MITEGSNLTVMCNPSGTPPPTLFWVKAGHGERTNGTDLVFTNIHRSQSGDYTCKANNPCGDASQSVEIDVQCKQSVKRLLWSHFSSPGSFAASKLTSFISGTNLRPLKLDGFVFALRYPFVRITKNQTRICPFIERGVYDRSKQDIWLCWCPTNA